MEGKKNVKGGKKKSDDIDDLVKQVSSLQVGGEKAELESLAELIKAGKVKEIIVLSGAGVSVE
jgi:major membrane immunogen (membrane-anchored lipoprotein)